MLIRVVDVESGGFDAADGLCEIAWTQLEHDGVKWVITRKESSLLKPKRPMGKGAIEVHGISEEMCANAPSDSFASNFLHWDGAPDFVVAHNWKFEEKWLEPRKALPICTLVCGRKIFPGAKSYKNENLFDFLNLRESALAGGHILEPMHRALPDTIVTAFTLMKMLETYTPDDLVAMTAGKTIGKTMSYGKYIGARIDDTKLIPAHYLRWILNESAMHNGHKADARDELTRRGELLIDPKDKTNR